MKREDLKNVDTEVLQKKYKAFKIAFYILAGIVGFMFIISFFNWKESGFSAGVLMPVFFIPMVIVNYLNFMKIKLELESRGKA